MNDLSDKHSDETPDLIAVQEYKMDDKELVRWGMTAIRKGYVTFASGTTTDRAGRPAGGATFLVRKGPLCRICAASNEGLHYVAVWIGEEIRVSTYASFRDSIDEGLKQLYEYLEATDSRAVMVGDWNMTPEEHRGGHRADPRSRRARRRYRYAGSGRSTKWTAAREIDYVVARNTRTAIQVERMEDKWADHMAIKVKATGHGVGEFDIDTIGPTKDLTKPLAVDRKEWEEPIEKLWKEDEAKHEVPTIDSQSGADEEWAKANTLIENCVIRALNEIAERHKEEVAEEVPRRRLHRRTRHKGSFPDIARARRECTTRPRG